MSGSTTKKVIVQRFDREAVPGFVNPHSYLSDTGLELLSVSGNIVHLPFIDVKTVCFVKDFDAADLAREKRLFATRPKSEGLWVRMRFRDNDVMDGMLTNNLLLIEPQGFTFIPPDASANNQKIFVPRQALVDLQVVGVVGSLLRKPRKKDVHEDQLSMFD